MINKMSSSSSEERKDPKLLAEIAFDQDMMSMIKHDPDKDCKHPRKPPHESEWKPSDRGYRAKQCS